MQPRRKAPDFEVAPVLEDEFGFENVPRCHGGEHRKVRCVFHGETNPSASVSRFGFRCHACGVSGDAIKLLREQGGMTYQDAVRRATELNGGVDPAVAQGDGDRQRWWNGDLFT